MINLEKIDYTKILIKRIINEIKSGNTDNALYLIDTFVFISSDNPAKPTELTEALTETSLKLIREYEFEKAEAFLSKALLVDPENQDTIYNLVQLKKIQQLTSSKAGKTRKTLVHKFVQTHLPEEINEFERIWRMHHDTPPEELKRLTKDKEPLPEKTDDELLKDFSGTPMEENLKTIFAFKDKIEKQRKKEGKKKPILDVTRTDTIKIIVLLNWVGEGDEHSKEEALRKVSEDLDFPEGLVQKFFDFLMKECAELPPNLQKFLGGDALASRPRDHFR